MKFDFRIPLVISFISAFGITAFGTTLTLKDYNNYNQAEHKVLGIEVLPIIAFPAWNASFVVRQSEFSTNVDEAINRIVGLIFFMILMVMSGVPSYMGYSLALLAYNKVSK